MNTRKLQTTYSISALEFGGEKYLLPKLPYTSLYSWNMKVTAKEIYLLGIKIAEVNLI